MTEQKQQEQQDNKISSLYRQGSSETPSNVINEKILKEAAQHSGNVTQLFFRSVINTMASSRPLAVAAVFIISISIILQIQFEHKDEITPQSFKQLNGDKKSPLFVLDEQKALPVPIESEIEAKSDTKAEADISIPAKTELKQKMKQAPALPQRKILKAAPKPSTKKDQEMARSKPLDERRKLERDRKPRESEQEKQVFEKKRAQQLQYRTKLAEEATEMQRLAPAVTQNFLSPESAVSNCEQFSLSECFSSNICVLEFDSEKIICREATNHCEQKFIQATDIATTCTDRKGCQFIHGECECDREQCDCLEDTIPSCTLPE